MNFSHLDADGNARMVNVTEKKIQKRKAIAQGIIYMNEGTIEQIKKLQISKGDVLNVAKIAGIHAAKQTSFLIPLCHNININFADIEFEITENCIIVKSTIECDAKTGVEMEALTAVSVALLTIYDMCKAVDKKMKISEICLVEKIKTDF